MARRAALVAVVFVAVAVGFVVGRVSGDRSSDHVASPRIIEGWGYRGDNDAVACCGQNAEHAGGTSYIIGDAHWRDMTTDTPSWREGPPECIKKEGATRIRLGFVEVRPTADQIGVERVAWVECLSR
ncbi:MAG: hypothetical protein QOK28_1562 [Actinomycetota bacterium]|jgi:phage terminase large subunit-like protein